MTTAQLKTLLRAAHAKATAALRAFGRLVVWLAAPVITSAQGAWDRTDIRVAITKALAVGGITWTGIKTASHDPEFVGAIVTFGILVAAGVHDAIIRKQNGPPGSPAGQPVPDAVPSPSPSNDPPQPPSGA
jgi:hypothetical protein